MTCSFWRGTNGVLRRDPSKQEKSQRKMCSQTGLEGISACIRVLVMMALTVSLSPTALAQKDAATIVGTVWDPSGAVVTGAQVTATDVDRGISFVTSTDSMGNYVAGPLKIGRYKVMVSKKDFQTLVIGPFQLQVGQRREIN